ncbi:MAG: hypothetical protein CO187_00930 [Zetaproteobacteria bacterium CG_4_9_14_3_um_filter_53_7]|nr:MAG: hypothetical protein CO187_00930 [Zetaproteobacteria bacterium CG_4_9_14_3_um_filter_53_7]
MSCVREALNNFVLKLFSTQRQKRGFSFAYNIKHLQCLMLAGHPCPAGYSVFQNILSAQMNVIGLVMTGNRYVAL